MVQNAPDGGDAAANQLFAPERCPTGAATGITTNRQQLTCVWLSKILEGSSIKKVEPAGLCSCLKPLLRRGLQGDHRRHR
ncbi:hypothetical protein MTP99_011524 [Tenebrio molitor]|nr:hypothetical protein MTP99_011524 [Tenebrio molitor]